MSKAKPVFSTEFKEDAANLILDKNYSYKEACEAVGVGANQPFSQWHNIFADTSMTVAAVDRLIHHAQIIELEGESYRKQAANERSMKASEAEIK